MRNRLFILILLLNPCVAFTQGFNHTWLLGYWAYPDTLGRINFTTSTAVLVLESRKMQFSDTQANISDSNGNFLMSSNGVWIANSLNDTMFNGSGLLTKFGFLNLTTSTQILYSNIILPMPQNSNKFILLHHDLDTLNGQFKVKVLYQTTIDMSLDSGRGAVISKNDTVLSDILNNGIASCRHANGRDWWIVMSRDNSDIMFSILLTPNGIDTIITQHTGITPFPICSFSQPTFSPDGKKFAFSYSPNSNIHKLYLLKFDRCTGLFSNSTTIDISDSYVGYGIAFSPNSKYLFACSTHHIFQMNTDTNNIQASLETVATNDTFYSPSPPFQTDFFFNVSSSKWKNLFSKR